jgi:hypothetical protein
VANGTRGGQYEQASVYVAPGGDAAAARVFDHPGLRVSAASPEHLLAMKVLAARRRDADDIRFLVRHLHLSTTDEVLAPPLLAARRGLAVEPLGGYATAGAADPPAPVVGYATPPEHAFPTAVNLFCAVLS